MNRMKKYHFPIKGLGQNFLIDKDIIAQIVQIINPKSNEILIEIGSGLAALTKPICRLIKELIVIEIDKNLLNFLKKYSFYSQLNIFCQNALKFDYLDLYNKKNKLIRIFGNLPYHISTSLIFYLFKNINIIKDMNFMLQKEVAERLVAVPGSKLYGRLSIIAQYYCDIKILLNIFPERFWPIPKVHSSFVNLTPHTSNVPYFTHNINILSYITNIAFQKRRKMLRHSLKKIFSENVLIKLDIDPKLRAENISISQYCRLSNYVVKNNILNNNFKKYIKEKK